MKPFQAAGVLLALALAATSSGCALFSNDPDAVRNIERETAQRHLELARAELDAGDDEAALDRLIALRDVSSLVPEQRSTCETMLVETIDAAIARLSRDEAGGRTWKALYKRDLPTRLKARVGVLTAERYLAEDRRVKAVRMIRQVENELPAHQERAAAGDVIGRAGLLLAVDDGRYSIFYSYRARGIESLEFLVLTYPFDPRCAEAYAVLGRAYEETGDLRYAIERYEDLLLYHPESDYAATAEARLPFLRMERLRRDDYDRGELVLAHREMQRWLERRAGHELEGWVRENLAECGRRLARSDLVLARFYRRIGNAFGARQHAERALREATAVGASAEIQRAQAVLADLPEKPVRRDIGEAPDSADPAEEIP